MRIGHPKRRKKMDTERRVSREPRNVLADFRNGKISLKRVYEIDREIMESADAPRIQTLMGLSDLEWKGKAHGVPFEVLARWRYHGWPKVCSACRTRLDWRNDDWFAVETKGVYVLVHIACLSLASKPQEARRSSRKQRHR